MKWLALFPNCIEQLNHSSSLDFHSFLLHFQFLHLRSKCANNMNLICKYVTLHQFGWWCPHCIVLTFALWRTLLCFLPFEGTLCPMKVTTVSLHSTCTYRSTQHKKQGHVLTCNRSTASLAFPCHHYYSEKISIPSRVNLGANLPSVCRACMGEHFMQEK